MACVFAQPGHLIATLRLVIVLSASSSALDPTLNPHLPTVLIFESKPAGKAADRDMNIGVGNYIASDFDSFGKANPIVYSDTDPIFRAAEDAGKLREIPKWPSLRQGFELGKKLGAEYVLVYEFGGIKRGASDAEAALYYQGRRIWNERLNLAVRNSQGFSVDASEQSLARTWVMHIGSGPLKSVTPVPKILNPTEAPGDAPKPISAAPIVKVDDDGQLKQKVAALIQSSDVPRAISALRDAVDQSPLDIDRRILLVQTLLDAGRAKEAGEEAERAVQIAPDRDDLRSLAARAWIAAGQGDQARQDLNQAAARDPQGAATRVMLAELSLAHQEPAKALDHLDAAIKEHPSRHAYYLRALCRAFLGDADGVKADLASADKLPEPAAPTELQRVYLLAGQSMDDGIKATGGDVRLLMQKALIRADDPDVRDKVSSTLQSLQARLAFLAGFPVPTVYKGSNDRRSLSHRLMVQCMLAMQTFCGGGGQDAMIDARLDLGESLKEAANARSAFEAEQHPTEVVKSGAGG